MPLLATFIGGISSALVAIFSQFMGFKAALKLAAYSAWMVVLVAYVVAVRICLDALFSLVGALVSGTGGAGVASWVSRFFMGIGMFIPSNAGAVMACIGSVWIATSIYRVQRDGIHTYGS